jgi:hypothetical protein
MAYVIPDAHRRWEHDERFTASEGQGVVKSGGWQAVIQCHKLNAHRREVRPLMAYVVPDAHRRWERDERFTEGQGVAKSGGWQAVIRCHKFNAHRREVRLLQFCSRVDLLVGTCIPQVGITDGWVRSYPITRHKAAIETRKEMFTNSPADQKENWAYHVLRDDEH